MVHKDFPLVSQKKVRERLQGFIEKYGVEKKWLKENLEISMVTLNRFLHMDKNIKINLLHKIIHFLDQCDKKE